MATLEIPFDQDRRDFLFAKGRSHNKQSPRPAGSHRSPIQPKRPEKGGNKFSRGQFIALAVAGSIGSAGVIAGILQPWNRSTPQPESSQPETLESLVTQAKRMEDDYRFQDLSNRPIREKYASILAGIFAFHYPEYFSRQQLVETISWDDSLDQFVRDRMASAGKTGTPTATQLANERDTTAATDNRRRKIIVNVAANSFKQQNINLIQGAPKGWNPLRTLRVSLLHEFNHLVTESADEIIFSVADPDNKFKDRRIEGFRFVSIDETGRYATSFTDLHEAVIELLAKDISLSGFGTHLGDMASETPGLSMDMIMNNLEQVLRAVGINHQELAKLHKSSNLRAFLLTLADKAGADINTPLDNKINFGSRIARVIVINDQRILQGYLNQVRSINPTSSQK